jgi:hypothetical protein
MQPLVALLSAMVLLLSTCTSGPRMSVPAPSSASPSTTTSPVTVTSTITYTDPSGWTAEYPLSWWTFQIDRTSDGLSKGVILTNAQGPRSRDPHVVRLTVTHAIDGASEPVANDSSIPLSMADALVVPGDSDIRVLAFRGNGVAYLATTWIGSDASTQDVAEADAVVASIRFASLERAQKANGWVSLGSRRFRNGVGTAEYVERRIGVAYVMRGPASTYVLAIPRFPTGYEEQCAQSLNMTWDAVRRQIWIRCPAGDVRYEVDGGPVPGNPAGLTTDLTAYPVITAWDGSRLVSTTPMSRSQAQRAWSGFVPGSGEVGSNDPPSRRGPQRGTAGSICSRWLRSIPGLLRPSARSSRLRGHAPQTAGGLPR